MFAVNKLCSGFDNTSFAVSTYAATDPVEAAKHILRELADAPHPG